MKPTHITVHCSATQNLPKYTGDVIKKMHTDKGWSDIGYHFVIETDGSLYIGRPITKTGAHVYGHNQNNIGICLIGGIAATGATTENYTEAQYSTLRSIVMVLSSVYDIPYSKIQGHRDWFEDANGDGIIDSRDWLKECPCFDVKGWVKNNVT